MSKWRQLKQQVNVLLGTESQQLGGCCSQGWPLYGPQWQKEVEKQQFLSWVKVAIDLDQPTKTFETIHGTLIQDESFANKVYLKGLLLETTSSAKRFKFGYDLMEGVVNRDRQRLSDTCEQAKILANIWEISMGEIAKGAISNYVKILLDKAQWRVVNRAESEISAKMIWQHQLGLGNRASNKHWCVYVRASRRAYTAAEPCWSPTGHCTPCNSKPSLLSAHTPIFYLWKLRNLGIKAVEGNRRIMTHTWV